MIDSDEDTIENSPDSSPLIPQPRDTRTTLTKEEWKFFATKEYVISKEQLPMPKQEKQIIFKELSYPNRIFDSREKIHTKVIEMQPNQLFLLLVTSKKVEIYSKSRIVKKFDFPNFTLGGEIQAEIVSILHINQHIFIVTSLYVHYIRREFRKFQFLGSLKFEKIGGNNLFGLSRRLHFFSQVIESRTNTFLHVQTQDYGSDIYFLRTTPRRGVLTRQRVLTLPIAHKKASRKIYYLKNVGRCFYVSFNYYYNRATENHSINLMAFCRFQRKVLKQINITLEKLDDEDEEEESFFNQKSFNFKKFHRRQFLVKLKEASRTGSEIIIPSRLSKFFFGQPESSHYDHDSDTLFVFGKIDVMKVENAMQCRKDLGSSVVVSFKRLINTKGFFDKLEDFHSFKVFFVKGRSYQMTGGQQRDPRHPKEASNSDKKGPKGSFFEVMVCGENKFVRIKTLDFETLELNDITNPALSQLGFLNEVKFQMFNFEKGVIYEEAADLRDNTQLFNATVAPELWDIAKRGVKAQNSMNFFVKKFFMKNLIPRNGKLFQVIRKGGGGLNCSILSTARDLPGQNQDFDIPAIKRILKIYQMPEELLHKLSGIPVENITIFRRKSFRDRVLLWWAPEKEKKKVAKILTPFLNLANLTHPEKPRERYMFMLKFDQPSKILKKKVVWLNKLGVFAVYLDTLVWGRVYLLDHSLYVKKRFKISNSFTKKNYLDKAVFFDEVKCRLIKVSKAKKNFVKEYCIDSFRILKKGENEFKIKFLRKIVIDDLEMPGILSCQLQTEPKPAQLLVVFQDGRQKSIFHFMAFSTDLKEIKCKLRVRLLEDDFIVHKMTFLKLTPDLVVFEKNSIELKKSDLDETTDLDFVPKRHFYVLLRWSKEVRYFTFWKDGLSTGSGCFGMVYEDSCLKLTDFDEYVRALKSAG